MQPHHNRKFNNPTFQTNHDVIIDGRIYRILELSVHGETGQSINMASRATEVLPDGTLQGDFVIKKTPPSRDNIILRTKNTAIRLRNAHPEISPMELAAFECGERELFQPSVTRLIPGTPLSLKMKEGRKNHPQDMILQTGWITALKIINALSPLHTAGLIHRDVKKGNLIVREQTIALADVDMLTTTEIWDKNNPHPIGTPTIMTPEMINHSNRVDHTTDYYQTACVIYEMTGGKLEKEDLLTTLKYRAKGKFGEEVNETLKQMKEHCPPQAAITLHRLSQWMTRCLENLPDKRPQTPAEHQQLITDTPNLETI